LTHLSQKALKTHRLGSPPSVRKETLAFIQHGAKKTGIYGADPSQHLESQLKEKIVD